jgi:ABC-type transport system substrate-binding protein
MGYGVGWEVTPGGLHEVNWTSTKFRTINFTFNMGNTYLEKVGQLLIDNLGKIGIEVEVYNESWADLLGKLFGMWGNTKDMLEMFYIGWMADYNDPSQFINFLFSNSSMYNTVQYNGGFGGFLLYNPENDVELLMEQAITSINRNERSQLYNKIQQLIIERDFPWIYGYTPKTYVAFHKDLEGIEENNFISVDEDGASSVKGDFQLLTWKYNPSFFPIYIISGYHFPYILLIAFISVIYFINYKRLKLRS